MDSPKPPTPLAVDAAQRVREFLAEAGYTRAGLETHADSLGSPSTAHRNQPRLRYVTREPTLLNVLLRWFLLGDPVARRLADDLVPEWLRTALLGCGLLEERGDELAATSQLEPAEGLLIASDLTPGLVMASDHVLAVNPSAQGLLRFTVGRPVKRTLDLGCGCGIQGLAAALHSERVVGTDLNPRAVAYAAFNARLNGIENTEWRTGNLFAPVEGERFDLIVCNPPFVIAPAKEYVYRDSGRELDGLCRDIAREAPSRIVDGGLFQMICEWAQVKGQPWSERIGGWFEGLGCDVWVLGVYRQEPSLYAQRRLSETPLESAERDARSYDEWMEYFERQGVEAIHGGFVALRRRGGKGSFRFDAVGEEIWKPYGEVIAQGFAIHDFLEAHASDEALLATRLCVSPLLRVQREWQRSAGAWRCDAVELRLASGPANVMALEPDVADFVTGFDGRRSVGQQIDALARRAGVDPAKARAEALRLVRGLLERGVLLPEGVAPVESTEGSPDEGPPR